VNTRKTKLGDLDPGDRIVYDSGLVKVGDSVFPAHKPGYVVIVFSDGSRGGGQADREVSVQSLEAENT
jgi:hypothetical protein